MTKVQLDYDLLRKMDDDDAEAIESVHSHYGIQRVQIAPTLDHITVDYDATRMSRADVGRVMVLHGVPVAI